MRKEETLDSVIEFLSNDSLWSLDVVTKCNDKKTPAQLAEDELVRKIKMELQGDDLTPYDVRLIRRYFELEQELSGGHRNVVAFLERLFVWYGIGNGVDSPKKYSKNKDNWLAAMSMFDPETVSCPVEMQPTMTSRPKCCIFDQVPIKLGLSWREIALIVRR